MSGVKKSPPGERSHVNIVLDSTARQLDRPFTYEIPDELRGTVRVGSVVLVPFLNTRHIGYVLEFCDPPDLPRIRKIEYLVEEPPFFDAETVELCKWMSRHYMSSLAQALRLVMPPGRARRVMELVELREEAGAALKNLHPRANRQREVIELLAGRGGSMTLSGLKSSLRGKLSSSVLRGLEESGSIGRRYILPRPKASRVEVAMVEITPDGEKALRQGGEWRKRAPARFRLLQALHGRGGKMTVPELQRVTRTSSTTLKATLEMSLARTWKEERLRDPFADRSFPRYLPHSLNTEQRTALEEITSSLDTGEGRVFLLHGITSSGKTEVYLHAINHALKKGATALVLVPEIALTPQMVQRFKGRLGEEVAVLHSRLAVGERFDQWRGIREGRHRVVIGARSALFAPLENLGLLIIDEEHENTYKEGSAPRYHARDVAVKRAQLCGSTLVLGSATPRLESLFKAENGDYRLIRLTRRIDDRPLPGAELVDMRELNQPGTRTILSPRLVNALAGVYRSGEQAMLFLNRRGFASFLQCHSCGYIFQCRNCSVSLCYHSREELLMCHHCGWRSRPPFTCPDCGNREHRYAGTGTERVQEELKHLLPPLRCIRMDADTTRHKGSHWDLLEDFKAGKAQVLLGTQMIAKGLDIPNVTLVGVINADTSLGLPDFRAGERTFHLLTQVGGRAGRGERPGKVIIQTYNPHHYAIQAAVRGDEESFFQQEVSYRREAMYPPFCSLINLVLTSRGEKHASSAAAGLAEIIRPSLGSEEGEILGPAPAPLSRIKGKYRYHLTVKAHDLGRATDKIGESLPAYEDFRASYCHDEGIAKEDVSLTIDVDPVTML